MRYATNNWAETKATPMPMTLAAVSDQKRTSPAKLSWTPSPNRPPMTCQNRNVRHLSAWADAAKQAVAPTLTIWLTRARPSTMAKVVPVTAAKPGLVPRTAVRKRLPISVLQSSQVPIGFYARRASEQPS
jgi:hypothetical protein